MEIIADAPESKFYYPMFGGKSVPMMVVWVTFIIPGEPTVSMSLSHRDDDPEGVWCADFRSDSEGRVAFSHGEGDRLCLKQVAGPEIVAAIEAAMV